MDDSDARAPSDAASPAIGADRLFAEVYDRLKAMAAHQLSMRPRGTLDTTALVHELYLRLGDRPELQFEQQAQFFAYAARAIRHLLADRPVHPVPLTHAGASTCIGTLRPLYSSSSQDRRSRKTRQL